jgi:hypothetical protein
MKKTLIISILSIVFIQNAFAQSVLITPNKSLDSDTLSVLKKIIIGNKWASKPDNKFEVFANGKTHLSVDVNGRVGVGTSLPQNHLQVDGRTQLNGRVFLNTTNFDSNNTNSNLAYGAITSVSSSSDSSDIDLINYSNDGYSPWLNFGKARGTMNNPVAIQNGDDVFQINGYGYANSDFITMGTIWLKMEGAQTSTSRPSAMYFQTVKEGSLSNSTSIKISKKGFVGIGEIEPEQNLSVKNGMNIDQDALNDGTLFNGLRFGSESKEGIASRRTGGDDSNFKGLDFFTNNNSRMTITNNGFIGIGTTNPTQAKLVVNGNANGSIGNFNYLQLGSPITGSNTTNSAYNYSIYASNRIAATEFNAFSDARIKEIKGISNNEKDLETLSKIQITDYQFKDKIGKGNGQYKKVIAQQVEGVYPQAVSKITDCIPDIYKLAKIENGFIQLENHNLKVGERVKLIFDDKQEIVEVKTISDLGFTIVDFHRINPKSLFIYGREVTDFRSVDYEALSMLNISATQALLKQINELKNQNETLKNALEENKNDFKQLKAELKELKTEFTKNFH